MTEGVFARLVGQPIAIEELSTAARIARVTRTVPQSQDKQPVHVAHSWLMTGPPGSGRSIAALCFAAALQCTDTSTPGCGRCHGCTTTMAGTHPDMYRLIPEGLSIGVKETRLIVQIATRYPSIGNWQIILIEDADRLTEESVNVLLKILEEPPPLTMFLLCAPSIAPNDVAVTLRSRCRHIGLVTPTPAAISDILIHQDGIEPQLASWAAAVSGGHVGRARRLATDPQARQRREQILRIPQTVVNPAAGYKVAEELVTAAENEITQAISSRDKQEIEQLRTALGSGGTGKGTAGVLRGTIGLFKDLDKRHKSRHTRGARDALDRALIDLAGYFRDALFFAQGVESVQLNHPDMRSQTSSLGQRIPAPQLLVCIEAILSCRTAIAMNVKPKFAIDAMMATIIQVLNP